MTKDKGASADAERVAKGVLGNLMASYRHWAHGIEADVSAVDLTEEEVEDLAAHLQTALSPPPSDARDELLREARAAIASLHEDAFGPILSGHGEHLGWVRDQLLARIDSILGDTK